MLDKLDKPTFEKATPCFYEGKSLAINCWENGVETLWQDTPFLIKNYWKMARKLTQCQISDFKIISTEQIHEITWKTKIWDAYYLKCSYSQKIST